ncbi:MAG: hypothetical protein CMJ48_04265 [Planctomycetaceae bacterium]|nr:hypothetical protein [Planctomycetaceae bacterium]
MTLRRCLAFALSTALTSSATAAPPTEPTPLSPTESLKLVHVRDDFEVELVAAEPLVKDPVAITWGPDGKLWVAEMADYPSGMDGAGKPGGRIRVLEDTKGDGRYDASHVFLEGIPFPNGVMPWRQGVLVTAAPEVFYAEDTTGDGKADKRESLLTGFFEGNQQLRVNGLQWGLDNRVHCAIGSHHAGYAADSKIRSTRAKSVVALGSRDFRFNPDTGELEPQSGPTQFGRNRDDWGHWYGCMNSHPLWHYVLQDHYLRRNLHVIAPDARKQLVVPRNPKVYPAKAPQKRFHSFEQSGRFTSACGAMFYRDALLFPSDGKQHAFTCEPFHNLVQHNVVTDDGVSFTSHRDPAESETDFFASKDRWCRPVMARTGPDGALWVVDMYRYMIEHPQWLTPEGREELKPYYRHGENQGRIYRVFRRGTRPRKTPNLEAMTTAQLVAELESPSGWQRDMVQKLLIWRADPSAQSPLERTVQTSRVPLARVHALCTLDGLSQITSGLLMYALQDEHPGVRRHAVRLGESQFESDITLARAATALVDDADARVRLQLACSLGEWPSAAAGAALADLALSDADDPYLAAALLSSANKTNLNTMLTVLLPKRQPGATGRLVGRLLALSVALDDRQTTLDALEIVLDSTQASEFAWQCSTLAGLFDALKRQKTSLEKLISPDDASRKDLPQRLDTLIAAARKRALDEGAAEADRLAAMRLMARTPASHKDDVQALGALLVPQTTSSVQKAALSRLGDLADREIAGVVLENWPSHLPSVRAEILNVLSTRREWLVALLDAIEKKQVAPSDVGPAARQRLLVYRDKKIRERVKKLLTPAGSADRQKVFQAHQDVLTLEGAASRAVPLFEKHCAVCHKLNGKGEDVGPDLNSITDKKPASLLRAMLEPSAAVDPKYITYAASTDDGRVFTGMLISETAANLTLVGQENKRQSILRSELDELRSTGLSLMPDGLEKELSHQDFADLIELIRVPGGEASGKQETSQ